MRLQHKEILLSQAVQKWDYNIKTYYYIFFFLFQDLRVLSVKQSFYHWALSPQPYSLLVNSVIMSHLLNNSISASCHLS